MKVKTFFVDENALDTEGKPLILAEMMIRNTELPRLGETISFNIPDIHGGGYCGELVYGENWHTWEDSNPIVHSRHNCYTAEGELAAVYFGVALRKSQ